jgi:hypothetical protein
MISLDRKRDTFDSLLGDGGINVFASEQFRDLRNKFNGEVGESRNQALKSFVRPDEFRLYQYSYRGRLSKIDWINSRWLLNDSNSGRVL